MRITCVLHATHMRSTTDTGAVGQVTAIKGKGSNRVVVFGDASSLENIECKISEVIPVNSHREFLRDIRTDTWVQVAARKSGSCEVFDVLEAMEEEKDRTPKTRAEKRKAALKQKRLEDVKKKKSKGMTCMNIACNAHVIRI